MLAGLAIVELELGLVADPLERLRPHAVSTASRRASAPSAASVGIPCSGDPRPAPPQPGDEDEVVVVSELLLAEVAEVADPAVVARPRVGRSGSVSSDAEEPLAHAPEVRHVLGGAERLALPAPELDVEVLAGAPWIRPSCSE